MKIKQTKMKKHLERMKYLNSHHFVETAVIKKLHVEAKSQFASLLLLDCHRHVTHLFFLPIETSLLLASRIPYLPACYFTGLCLSVSFTDFSLSLKVEMPQGLVPALSVFLVWAHSTGDSTWFQTFNYYLILMTPKHASLK